MLWKLVFVAIAIAIASSIYIQLDPQREYFQTAFSNDIPGLIRAVLSSKPELFNDLNSSISTIKTKYPHYRHVVVPDNNEEIVQLLINTPELLPRPARQFICNLRDSHGNGLYHWASKQLHVEYIHFLVQLQCKFDIINDQGSSPFMWAATSTRLDPQEFPEYIQSEQFLYQQNQKLQQQQQQQQAEEYQNEQLHPDFPLSTASSHDESSDLHTTTQDEQSSQEPDHPPVIKPTEFAEIPMNPVMQYFFITALAQDLFQEFLRQIDMIYPSTTRYTKINLRHLSHTSHLEHLVRHVNFIGETPLHFAVNFMSVSSIKTLLSFPSLLYETIRVLFPPFILPLTQHQTFFVNSTEPFSTQHVQFITGMIADKISIHSLRDTTVDINSQYVPLHLQAILLQIANITVATTSTFQHNLQRQTAAMILHGFDDDDDVHDDDKQHHREIVSMGSLLEHVLTAKTTTTTTATTTTTTTLSPNNTQLLPISSIFNTSVTSHQLVQASLSTLHAFGHISAIIFDKKLFLEAQITETSNTPLHLLPPDCQDKHTCHKIVTWLVSVQANMKATNRYKRMPDHHIVLNEITPLLSPQDELMVYLFNVFTQPLASYDIPDKKINSDVDLEDVTIIGNETNIDSTYDALYGMSNHHYVDVSTTHLITNQVILKQVVHILLDSVHISYTTLSEQLYREYTPTLTTATTNTTIQGSSLTTKDIDENSEIVQQQQQQLDQLKALKEANKAQRQRRRQQKGL